MYYNKNNYTLQVRLQNYFSTKKLTLEDLSVSPYLIHIISKITYF